MPADPAFVNVPPKRQTGGERGLGGVRHSIQPAHVPLAQAHLFAQSLVLDWQPGGQSGGGGDGGDGERGLGGVRHSIQPAHVPLAQAHLFAQALVLDWQPGGQSSGGGDGGDGERGLGGVRHSKQPAHVPLAQAHLFAQALVLDWQPGGQKVLTPSHGSTSPSRVRETARKLCRRNSRDICPTRTSCPTD